MTNQTHLLGPAAVHGAGQHRLALQNAEAVQNFLHPQPTRSPTFTSTNGAPSARPALGPGESMKPVSQAAPVARKVGGMRKCKRAAK